MSKKEELQFDVEGHVDVEAIIDERSYNTPPTEYVAPGKDRKWRARDLLDIHWKLVGIKCPESFRSIMSCIVGHANPLSGVCYPRHKTIARETGYSVETTKRAIKWWTQREFLKTESRGLAHALAYHPQWALFEMFWTAVTTEIAAQKACLDNFYTEAGDLSPKVTKGTYAKVIKGTYGEDQYGDLHKLKEITSKKDFHPERAHPPSACDAIASSMNEKEEAFRNEEFVADSSVQSQTQCHPEGPTEFEAHTAISEYCTEFDWEHLSDEAYAAAVEAEMKVRGGGLAVVKAAAMDAWRAKRKEAIQ